MTETDPPPVELEINGILDLHTFNPKDVKSLVNEYLDACREKGILEVRIIHGKGTGKLRQRVYAILEKRDDIAEYKPASDYGGWGATVIRLAYSSAGSGA